MARENKGCHRGLGVPLKSSHVLYALVKRACNVNKKTKNGQKAEKGGSGVQGI